MRYDFFCPSGTLFDQSLGVCVWAHTAPKECFGQLTTTVKHDTTPTTTPVPTTVEISTPSVEFVCPDEGSWLLPGCTKYAVCVKIPGTKDEFYIYIFPCPEGTLYDKSKDSCVWRSEAPAECFGEVTTKIPTTTLEVSTPTNGMTTKKSEFVCPGEGSWPLPGCVKYAVCVKIPYTEDEYYIYIFSCPDGTLYDKRKDSCVWPSEAPSECFGETTLLVSTAETTQKYQTTGELIHNIFRTKK